MSSSPVCRATLVTPNLANKGSTRERVSRGEMILSEYMDWSVRMPAQPST